MNNLKYSNGSATYVESLEKKIAELEKQIVAIDMNNEPVAWIKQGKLGYPVLEFDKPFRYKSYAIQNPPIPLYTHPVKELTDEKIEQTWQKSNEVIGKMGLTYVREIILPFARAILRKASEK